MAQDDKYGLEPADDKYGLQPAGAPTATAEPPSDEEIEAAYGKDVSPKIRAALKSGVAPMKPPTNFEAARPPIPENYGFTPGNVAKNVVKGAADLAQSGYDLGKDVLFSEGKDKEGNETHGLGGLVGLNAEGHFDPLNRVNTLTQKYITDPAVAEWNKGDEEGGTAGVGHKAAAMLPLVGPWAASLGEQAGTGDVGGAAGQVGGQIALGELAKHAPALADKVIRGTPLTEAGKLEAAKQQALTVKKPGMTETEYSAKVQDALPDLQKIAQDNAGKIKNPRDAVGAINRRVQEMEAPISEHLKGLDKPEDMVHADQYHDQIDKAIDAEMAKHPGQLTAAEMEKAKASIDKFVGDQPKTLAEVEGNRKRLNQDAEDYYKSRPADKRVMDSSDATAIAQRAAANAIRNILYGDDANPGLLEKAGVTAVDQAGNQVPLREFRRKVGNLLEVRDHFEDAITRAEQTGNWKAFDKIYSGPSLAAGGLGMIAGGAFGGPIGALFGTLAGEGAKAWGDYLRSKNPNLNVEKMFRNLENTGTPNTLEPITAPVQHQYENAIGPQTSQFAEPIGPARPPGNFQMEDLAPNKEALWQQQVGQPPPLETGAPSPGRSVEPIGPRPAAETPLAPIQGQQIPLHLPSGPGEAPLFGIEHPAPRAGGLGPIEGISAEGKMEQLGGGAGEEAEKPAEQKTTVKPMLPQGASFSDIEDSEEGKGWKEFYVQGPTGLPEAHMIISPEGKALAVRLVETMKRSRGQGYATAAYNHAIEYAKQNGFTSLISDPEGGTAEGAAAIWKKLGAEQEGTKKNPSFRLDFGGSKELAPGQTTFDKFYDKAADAWTPEREAMHTKIADKAVEGKTAPTDRPPEAIITVGGTAAGKTTLTRQILGKLENIVNVDSDANKLEIPEYEGLKRSDPKKAAARVHDESKAISKRTIQEAVGKGLDFIYDTSTGGGGEALFNKLKELGYRVRVIYADVPTEEAVKRAKLRAKESTDPINRGRIVPDDVVRKKHQEAAQAFIRYQNSPNVDEVSAYDTTERKPKRFYSRVEDRERVHDRQILDRVKEKANEQTRATKEKK